MEEKLNKVVRYGNKSSYKRKLEFLIWCDVKKLDEYILDHWGKSKRLDLEKKGKLAILSAS